MSNSRTMEPVPKLSQRVQDLIAVKFGPAEQARARELVREFHWALAPLVDERIHLDMLEICSGKLEKLEELVGLAKVDWRDLIMAAEYEVQNGKIVQNERGRTRLAEVSAAKKERADK